MKRLLVGCAALLALACGEEAEEQAASTAASGGGQGGQGAQGGSTASAGGGGGAVSCDPPDIAPKLHYRFDGDATNAGELGAAYDGVSAMVSYVPGKIGDAVKLAGPVCTNSAPSPSQVDLPGTAAFLQTASKVTIGLWYRQAEAPETSCVPYLLKCRGDGSGFETYQGGAARPGELTTCYTAADNTTSMCRSFQGPPDGWHHLLYRYDGAGAPLEIYLDNELVVSLDNAIALFGSVLDDLSVGRFSFFEIDELKLYDEVFDAETQCNEVIGGCWTDGRCVMPR